MEERLARLLPSNFVYLFHFIFFELDCMEGEGGKQKTVDGGLLDCGFFGMRCRFEFFVFIQPFVLHVNFAMFIIVFSCLVSTLSLLSSRLLLCAGLLKINVAASFFMLKVVGCG